MTSSTGHNWKCTGCGELYVEYPVKYQSDGRGNMLQSHSGCKKCGVNYMGLVKI